MTSACGPYNLGGSATLPSPRWLGGDWELGDHLVELVDDPTQVVSGCGRFTAMGVKELTHRDHLILAWIKGELHPCAGAPTRTSGEWRLSNTSAKHRRIPPSLFTLSIYFEQFNSCHLHS